MSNQVHASRLLTVIPFPVSDLFKPAYSFGGMPMIQAGRPYVDNWLGYSIFVLKTNMQSVLAGAEDADLIKRVALFNKYRNWRRWRARPQSANLRFLFPPTAY